MPPQKLLIDTDPGDDVDDVLALAFALRRPELDVRAITTVTSFPEQRVHIVRKLLRLLGHANIPVAAGNAVPLSGAKGEVSSSPPSGGYVLNHYAVVTPEEAASEPAVDTDAVGLILRTIEANLGEVAVITIGPMTNIAAALRRKPEIARLIPWIAIMGGEMHLDRTEHNVNWDAEAADTVLQSGVSLFMGTWDITRRVVLLPEHCEQIREHGTLLSEALARCIDLWWPHKAHKPGPVMYDLAPILWSMDRAAGQSGLHYTTQPMSVRVQTESGPARGKTVVFPDTEPNAQVTTDMTEAQALAARTLLLETLLG
jgi:inosine-uridine nucleoside N-ribohydrolase